MVVEEIVSAYEMLHGTVLVWMAMFNFVQIYIYLTLFSLVLWAVLKVPHLVVIHIGGWVERMLYSYRTRDLTFTERQLYEATFTDKYARFVRELRKTMTNCVRVSTKIITYTLIFTLHGGMTMMMLYMIMAAEGGTANATEFLTLINDIITNIPVLLLTALSFIFLYACVTGVVLAWTIMEYSIKRDSGFEGIRYGDLIRREG